jgi:hypothetical protein
VTDPNRAAKRDALLETQDALRALISQAEQLVQDLDAYRSDDFTSWKAVVGRLEIFRSTLAEVRRLV